MPVELQLLVLVHCRFESCRSFGYVAEIGRRATVSLSLVVGTVTQTPWQMPMELHHGKGRGFESRHRSRHVRSDVAQHGRAFPPLFHQPLAANTPTTLGEYQRNYIAPKNGIIRGFNSPLAKTSRRKTTPWGGDGTPDCFFTLVAMSNISGKCW